MGMLSISLVVKDMGSTPLVSIHLWNVSDITHREPIPDELFILDASLASRNLWLCGNLRNNLQLR